MAVDSRGFATGFAQGFGMMDQYQTRQRQAEVQQQQLGLQQERLGLQRDQIEYGKEQDKLGREYKAEKDKRDKERWDAEFGLKEQTTAANIANQEFTKGRLIEQDKQTRKDNQFKEDELRSKGIYANIAAGATLDDEAWDALEAVHGRNPSLVAAPLLKSMQQRKDFAQNQESINATVGAINKLLTPGAELTGEETRAIMNANNDISKAASPAALEVSAIIDRVFDPNDDFNENSPEALGAFNYIFGDMLGKGKTIVGVYPGKTPGTISLDLDTPNAKGVPMTVNRGTEQDGDNEVLEIPVEKAIDAIKGFNALANRFAMDPETREKALRFARTMGLAPEKKEEDKPKVYTEATYGENEIGDPKKTGERSYILVEDPKTGRRYKQYLEEEPLEGGEITDDELLAKGRQKVAAGQLTPELFQVMYGVPYEMEQKPPPPQGNGVPTSVGRPTGAIGITQPNPLDDTTSILMRGGL